MAVRLTPDTEKVCGVAVVPHLENEVKFDVTVISGAGANTKYFKVNPFCVKPTISIAPSAFKSIAVIELKLAAAVPKS